MTSMLLDTTHSAHNPNLLLTALQTQHALHTPHCWSAHPPHGPHTQCLCSVLPQASMRQPQALGTQPGCIIEVEFTGCSHDTVCIRHHQQVLPSCAHHTPGPSRSNLECIGGCNHVVLLQQAGAACPRLRCSCCVSQQQGQLELLFGQGPPRGALP